MYLVTVCDRLKQTKELVAELKQLFEIGGKTIQKNRIGKVSFFITRRLNVNGKHRLVQPWPAASNSLS